MVVLPFWEGPKAASEGDAFDLKAVLKDFKGKSGETALYYEGGQRILLLGLGKQEKASVEGLRRAYAAATKAACAKRVKEIGIVFPKCKQKEEFFRGIAEGVLLTNYSFTYKRDSVKENPIVLLEKGVWIGIERAEGLEEIETIVEGVCFVRNLVNANADDKIEKLVAAAKKLHPKVKVKVLGKKEIEEEGMGLLLAVNRASAKEPHFIEATYRGDPKSNEHVVLVGKGITYDTGGLSLKPTDGMVDMKCDMAGAATVLGAVRTAAALGLKVNVTAVAAVTENCIGSKSYKLGDVYPSYSGKTVEITNTDAEGRLVLADALGYAVKNLAPSCIVDLATLTGACVVALGDEIAGLFSNDDALAEDLLEVSEWTDEMLCRLPVYGDYLEAYKSEIADLVNSSGREAGAIKAALFLKEFVGEVPWAHLDIAGPAYPAKPKHYHPMKGTGYGVRLLTEFLSRKAK